MSKSDDSSTSNAFEDDAIWRHEEHFKRSQRWRLGDYGDEGILNEEQIDLLVSKQGLPEPVVRRLSVYLGNCLGVYEGVAINLTKFTPSKAIARGAKELGEINSRLLSIGELLEKTELGLSELSPDLAESPTDAALLPALQQSFSALVRDWERLEFSAACEEILSAEGAVAAPRPDDKRTLTDGRRILVVESCCYAWQEAGREIGRPAGASESKGDKRRGRLIDLIQAVAKMVSEKGITLSAETIREDIKRFRKTSAFREENDKGLGEPTFGSGPVT